MLRSRLNRPRGFGQLVNSFRNINRRGSAEYVDGHQAHHIVPLECANKPLIARMLDGASAFGFHLNIFRLNGILLPSNESAAKETGRPLHLGSHPRYSRFVINEMMQIADRTSDLSRSIRPIQSHLQITALVSTLHHALLTNPIPGTIQTLDEIPLHGLTDQEFAQMVDQSIRKK